MQFLTWVTLRRTLFELRPLGPILTLGSISAGQDFNNLILFYSGVLIFTFLYFKSLQLWWSIKSRNESIFCIFTANAKDPSERQKTEKKSVAKFFSLSQEKAKVAEDETFASDVTESDIPISKCVCACSCVFVRVCVWVCVREPSLANGKAWERELPAESASGRHFYAFVGAWNWNLITLAHLKLEKKKNEDNSFTNFSITSSWLKNPVFGPKTRRPWPSFDRLQFFGGEQKKSGLKRSRPRQNRANTDTDTDTDVALITDSETWRRSYSKGLLTGNNFTLKLLDYFWTVTSALKCRQNIHIL